MKHTVKSEWRKLTSIRMWIGLAVAAAAFTALRGILLLLWLSGAEDPGGDAAAMRNLYAQAGQAILFALVLGILAITSEYRHKTITATLLATPRRDKLVLAKMAAAAIFGAAIGLLCVAVTAVMVGVGVVWLDIGPVVWADVARIAGGAIVGCAVYAALGVGFGSLVRNQIAAILIALVWVLVVEGLLVTFIPEVGRWLPGGALSGVLQAEAFTRSSYLAVLPATLVLLGYVAVFGAVGAQSMRRDVT